MTTTTKKRPFFLSKKQATNGAIFPKEQLSLDRSRWTAVKAMSRLLYKAFYPTSSVQAYLYAINQ